MTSSFFPQALTPLLTPSPSPSPIPTPSLQGGGVPIRTASTAASIASSSSSAISRQSSCRSTASVQAVPFRTPIRGGNGNGLTGRTFDPISGGLTSKNGNVNGGGGGSYFNGIPATLKKMVDGIPGGGGGDDTKPSNSNLATISNRPGNIGLGPPPSSAIYGSSNSSFVVAADNSYEFLNSAPSEGGGAEKNLRPEAGRHASSNLSDKPARRELSALEKLKEGEKEGGGSPNASVLVRKTVTDFEYGDVLGEGSYSTVYLVTDKNSPFRQYALKVLDKEHIKREKKTKYVLIERDTLKILDGHPGIVRLYWTFQDARSLYYVLELAKNGELLKWIKKFGSFSLPCATFYAAQILSAVEHMHSKGVIHRDLKPENILLDDKMRVKVTDFGTAKLLVDGEMEELRESVDGVKSPDSPPTRARSRSFVGTPEYVSPEILSEKKESSKSSDYWGFGCILYQIIAGRPPFQARTEYLMFQKIIKLEYDFPEDFPLGAKDLVQKLLVLDPETRLGGGPTGIAAIKSHSFFSSISFADIWTCDPPPLETGITPPKIDQIGEFVMPPGFDDDGMDDDEEVVEEGFGSEDNFGAVFAGERRGVGESSNGSSGGQTTARTETTTVEQPSTTATKWSPILLPTETILFLSPVLDRTNFLSKKRTLILTDTPRLLCVKEVPTKVTVKSEVLIGRGISGKGEGVSMRLIRADTENDKVFSVKTTQRTFKYEEPSGGALRWVTELKEAAEGVVAGHYGAR